MFDSKYNQYVVSVDIADKPLPKTELMLKKNSLKYTYLSNHSFIFAMFVLGIAITYHAIMHGYDNNLELLKDY